MVANHDSRTPNLLVLGVPKSATTSIAEALAASSDVAVGERKEAGILTNRGYGDQQMRRLYVRHFRNAPRSATYLMDASPWLIYRPDALTIASRLIDRQLPIESVISLREPFSRINSMYLDQVMRGRETRSLATALIAETNALASMDVTSRHQELNTTSYLRATLYGEFLGALDLEAKGVRPPFILFFEDICDNDRRSTSLGWLGDGLSIAPGEFRQRNERGSPVGRLVPSIDRLTKIGSRLPARLKAPIRPIAGRIADVAKGMPGQFTPDQGPDAQLTPDLVERVRIVLEQDRLRILDVLGRFRTGPLDLPDWVVAEVQRPEHDS